MSDNYGGISLVSECSKLLGTTIPFGLGYAVDKVFRQEQCSFRKGRGFFDQIFTLSLIIEKCLSHQTPLVFTCIN